MTDLATESDPRFQFYRLVDRIGIDDLMSRIKEILEENSGHNLETFDLNHWEWQYLSLPTHESRIYVVSSDSKIVGYYHVPIYLGMIANQSVKFAMVQDVAISSEMRGAGLFRKLADFATNDLESSGLDIAYTFPNKKSVHTFLKYNGYLRISSLRSYIFPIQSKQLIEKKFKLFGIERVLGFLIDRFSSALAPRFSKTDSLQKHEMFSPEILSLAKKFTKQFQVYLARDEPYLSWRFINKPSAKYHLISLKRNGEIKACGTFKVDQVMDTSTLILMDFCFEQERDLHILISGIRKNLAVYFDQQITAIFTAQMGSSFLSRKRRGFLRIPESLNPRPLELLVKPLNKSLSRHWSQSKNWFVSLADWDVL